MTTMTMILKRTLHRKYSQKESGSKPGRSFMTLTSDPTRPKVLTW